METQIMHERKGKLNVKLMLIVVFREQNHK